MSDADKSIYAISQDENYQKCRLLKIINECYILIQIGNKKYVSKLTGFSFDTMPCHKSWRKTEIRRFKICSINRWVRWRGDNYQFYLLDVSLEKNFSEILMAYKDLNGYGSITHQMLRNGEAILDKNYMGTYSVNLQKVVAKAKLNKNGLLKELKKDWLERITTKGFNLKDFPEAPPTVIGEWKPSKEQQQESSRIRRF